jgi:phosphate transport system permease protein
MLRLATVLRLGCATYIFLDIGIKGSRTVFTKTAPFINVPFLTEPPQTLYVFQHEGKEMTLSDRQFRDWKGKNPDVVVEPSTVAYSAGGIWPAIVGTALLVIGSMVLALVSGSAARSTSANTVATTVGFAWCAWRF